MRPDYVEVFLNLGDLFLEQNRYQDAENTYKSAIKLRPDFVQVYSNLGNLFKQQKRYQAAEDCYLIALELSPDYVDAHFNRSMLLLSQGYFQKGWEEYESRFHVNNENRQTFPPEIRVPLWQGESLSGRCILIWPEQGVGDEIMFASCLYDLKNSKAQIILACDIRLRDLFSRSFPFVKVVDKDPLNRYQKIESSLDYHCGIGSLPKFFRNNLNTIIQSVKQCILIKRFYQIFCDIKLNCIQ